MLELSHEGAHIPSVRLNRFQGLNPRANWNDLWQRLQAHEVPVDIFDDVIALYSAPDRFYHNLSHLEDCFQTFKLAEPIAIHPNEVALAIWFHDAIYDSQGHENEQKSAIWAASVIRQAGVENSVAERVSQLILATCHTGAVTDIDTQIMVDVDLSILGSHEEKFWQYEANIRREYAWVPESLFKQKRSQILQCFLERKYIYHLEIYRDKFEAIAHQNIKQAITKLEI